MIRHLSIIVILFCLPLLAQERDIVPALKLIERGDIEAANSILQSYKTDFPDDPSVMFLDGVLTKDGNAAVKIYATVAQRFPNSKYADAALYRIFSYYYSIGYYERAKGYIDKLKNDYPNSPYIKMGDRDIPDSESLALAQASEQNKPEVGDLLKTSSGNASGNSGGNADTKSAASVELLKKSSSALEKLASSNSNADEKTNTKTDTKPNVRTNEKPAVKTSPKNPANATGNANPASPSNSATSLPPGSAPDSAPTIPPITQEAKKEVFQPNLNDAANANFTIQAGAFLNEDNAKKLSERFKKDGYYSKLGVKNVGGADFNIVYIGRFKTEEDGKLILDYLKDNHRIYGRIIPIEE
ncbi:hypothetical protein APF79_00060 [bacterium BRH_c32]|nr:MAG: hypothetical protein APF79_00060 [bacterium BRH_c32]